MNINLKPQTNFEKYEVSDFSVLTNLVGVEDSLALCAYDEFTKEYVVIHFLKNQNKPFFLTACKFGYPRRIGTRKIKNKDIIKTIVDFEEANDYYYEKIESNSILINTDNKEIFWVLAYKIGTVHVIDLNTGIIKYIDEYNIDLNKNWKCINSEYFELYERR